MDQNFDIDQRN